MGGTAIGDFLGTDRFVVERRIGEGGMGIVYEATDRRTEARIALKTLRTLSGQALARLKNEFRNLQEIEHPNLVSLGELVETDGHWFITMELVRGTTLLDYVSVAPRLDEVDVFGETREGAAPHRFDEARLRDAFGQLAGALQALHDVGLVHRDIKPGNILVSNEGRVVLLDFGLVTDLRGPNDSLEDNVVGTAAYMAPEQAAAGPVTAAADWYAFGVALYEALTGRLPFGGTTLQMLLEKQQAPVVPPGRRGASVPDDLDALCTDLLAFDPAARPRGSQVLRFFGTERARTAPLLSSSSTSDLIGREDELERLRSAYAEARAAGPLAIYVRGESGLGKSALVQTFTSELRSGAEPALLLGGRCYQNEAVPFKAVDGVIDSLTRAMLQMRRSEAAELVPRNAALLPQIFPALGRVEVIARAPRPTRLSNDPIEQRTRAFAALRELFQLLVERRPVVISVDDLHWTDDDSTRLLAELLAPPDAPPLLFLATARDGYELPSLPCRTDRIELGPLEPAAARGFAKRLLDRVGVRSGVSPGALAVEARGHPLHIEELARHVAESGDEPQYAPRLDEAIWQRIRRLPDDSRRLVELVAVGASPLPHQVLLVASELPAEEFSRHVSRLRVDHLVKSGGTAARPTLQPYHDRVRESVAANLEPAPLAEHHRRLAVGLELSGDQDLERLAAHLLGAGDVDRAIDVFQSAAERAMEGLAFARAARIHQQILELLPDGDGRRFAITERLGDALASVGRGLEAAAAYRAALAGVSEARKLDLQRMVAEQLLRNGHLDEGVEAIEQLARAGGMRLAATPGQALRQLLWLRARVAVRGYRYKLRDEGEVPASVLARIDTARAVADTLGYSEPVPAAVFHNHGLLAALRAGEPVRLAQALAGEAVRISLGGVASVGKTTRVLELLGEVVGHALAAGGEASLRLLERGAVGLVAYHQGQFEDCSAICDEAQQELVALGEHGFLLSTVRLYRVRSALFLGRWRELCTQLPVLLRDARDRSDIYSSTTLITNLGIYPHLRRDDPDSARRELDAALESWSTRTVQLQHVLGLMAHTRLDLYLGDHAAAFERMEAGWRDVKSSLSLRIELLRGLLWELRGVAALAHARGGGGKAAVTVARRALRQLARVPAPWARPVHAQLSAGIAFHDGEHGRACAELERAIEQAGALSNYARAGRYALGRIRDRPADVDAVCEELRADGFAAPARFVRVSTPWAP